MLGREIIELGTRRHSTLTQQARQRRAFQQHCSEKSWRLDWLAGGEGFRTLKSGDMKTPPGQGLAAMEGRSARHIHCRKDWTSAANGASVSPC